MSANKFTRPYPHFEFESHELSRRNHEGNEICAMLRVEYDLASDPGEILHIEDVDTGQVYTFLQLPPDDGQYILLRLRELAAEKIPHPHGDVDRAYENGLDKKRCD